MPSTPSGSRSSRSKSRSAAPPERRLSLLLLLVAAHQRMTQLVDLELATDGVDSNGYAMLSLIGVRGPVRLTEIAAELGMPLTTASDVMRRLESRRHVRRTPNPEDGRSFLFELTTRGDREWRRGWGALQRIDEALASRIEPQETRTALEALDAAFAAALIDD
jgi:MarR family transcriptional regulator, multiple antibiotic resistance protein MarR